MWCFCLGFITRIPQFPAHIPDLPQENLAMKWPPGWWGGSWQGTCTSLLPVLHVCREDLLPGSYIC